MTLSKFAKRGYSPWQLFWTSLLRILGWLFTFIFGRGYKYSIFGRRIRKSHFLLDEKITPLNHPSKGTVPKAVMRVQRKFQDDTEKSPDVWFRYKLQPLWERSLRSVAEFVGADFANTVFVPNTTSGINAVLRNFGLDEDDAVLITNQCYGPVEKTAREVCQATGTKLLVLNITYPTQDFHGTSKFYIDDIVQHFREVLKRNPSIELAVVDYIGSSNAVLYPVKELIAVCHQHNVAVLVDGEHAPGHVPLNLEELGADFFVGNFHKWTFAPRGCSILWIHPRYHHIVDPMVMSHFDVDGTIHDKFFTKETLDYITFVTAHAAIRFYQEIGGMESLTSYNQILVSWAAEMLASEWKTEILPIPRSMRAPFMAVVRLPDAISVYYGQSDQGAERAISDLYKKFKITGCAVCIQGSLWCRISAQVYNTKKDYFQLSKAVKQMKNEALILLLHQSNQSPVKEATRRGSWCFTDDQD